MAFKHVIKVNDVCQIVDKSQLITEQRNTVSLTNNGDGSISLTGAATDYEWVPITQISNRKIIKDHVYLLGGNSYKNSLVAMYGMCILSTGNQDFGYFSYNNEWVRFISNYTGYFQIMLQMRDVILDNFKITPQLFDLTDMYGAGNEPATVAEFREKFPNDYYPYTPYNYLQSNKRMIKVSDVCQLYAKNIWKEYTDLYGVSIKNNNDGSITLNGTATETFFYTNILDYEIKPNHAYFYFDAYNEEPSWSTYVGGCEGKLIDAGGASGANYAIYNLKREGTIAKARPDLPKNLLNTFCLCYKGFTFNNITVKPQLFDLTEMFGAGHEPATVAEFRQRFPNELYPYSPQCWLTSYKSAVVCKTKNLFDYKTTSTNNPIDWQNVKLSLHEDYIELSGTQQPDKVIELGWDGFNIPFEVGKTYTLSADTKIPGFASMFMSAHYTDGQSPSNIWEAISWNLSQGTVRKIFTPTRPGYFDRLTFYNPLKNHFSGDYIFRVQLEQGSTATSYVPYQHL